MALSNNSYVYNGGENKPTVTAYDPEDNQEIAYTGQPVVLEGNLAVSENTGNIKVTDLTTKWYDSENNEIIFDGLNAAYKGGRIGEISNLITKIWNSEDVNYDIIKLLVMENNFTIDYAKTLFKPTRPANIHTLNMLKKS